VSVCCCLLLLLLIIDLVLLSIFLLCILQISSYKVIAGGRFTTAKHSYHTTSSIGFWRGSLFGPWSTVCEKDLFFSLSFWIKFKQETGTLLLLCFPLQNSSLQEEKLNSENLACYVLQATCGLGFRVPVVCVHICVLAHVEALHVYVMC